MTVFRSDKVEKSLIKKGFVLEPKHHRFYCLHDEDNKRTSVRTKVSHNGQDINDFLINQMKKQLHLTKDEFCDLINCPLEYEKYLELLREQGIISRR